MNEIHGRRDRLLILGGAGRVGRAAGLELRRRGHDLLFTARDAAERERFLRDSSLPAESCAVVDFSDEASTSSFLAGPATRFHPDHVLLSFAQSTQPTPLLAAEDGEFARVLDAQVHSQYRALRSLCPRLSPTSKFVMINGSTALHPTAEQGLVHVSAAATLMLQRAVAAERGAGPWALSLLLRGAVGAADLPRDKQITAEQLADALERLFAMRQPRSSVFGLRPQSGLRALGLTVEESTDLEELSGGVA